MSTSNLQTLSPSAASSSTSGKSSSSSSTSLLKIKPKEIVFHPPFQGFISNQLKLYNSSEHNLAYKVKTTAPIKYCVRPNTGIIPPGETIDVQIILNCAKDVPSISMKTKDKFQIQSTIVSERSTDPKLVWSNTSQNQIMKQRLKAVFTLPSHSEIDHQHQQQQSQSQHLNDVSSVVGDQQHESDSADEQLFESHAALDNSDSSSFHNTPSSFSTISSASSLPSSSVQSNDDSTSSPTSDYSNVIKKRIVPNIKVTVPSSTTSSSPSTNNSKNNTNDDVSKTSEQSTKDRDYVNENAQLTTQIKQMQDKIEGLEKKVKEGEVVTVNNSASLSNIKLLLSVFIIAVISFYFGRMFAQQQKL